MGYESDGSGFESSSEQVDASLSNDSIDAGNINITESPEQYDFDESDVGEYIPEGELPGEDQEGSIETTEIPEMSDSGSLESREFDEDDFDESDVGEYDPEALNENTESSDDDIEASYKESAELGDSAENDFDESDVGEYDPEIVEGKIDADVEADGDNYVEHADADTVETPKVSELGEDTDFIEMDEETESDEEDFEGASEEVKFGGENVEGTGEDAASGFDVENADVSESADSVFEDIDSNAESIDKSSEDTYEDAELNEWTTEDASDGTESNSDNPEEVDEDADFSEEGSEGDDDDIESIEIDSGNTGEEGSDFVEDVSEGTDESAESDEESTENVGEGVESDDEVNLEGEKDSGSDEELPEDAGESSEYDGESTEVVCESVESDGEENLEGEEDSNSSEELPEVTDENSDFETESVEDADEDAESDEDDTEVTDEHIKSDEETSENGTENTESGSEKLRFGDRKSLILVDASNKTYVQELREVAEPDDAEHETKPEPQSKAVDALTEAVEVSPEEVERNLETFNEIETAEYERQKQFDVYEEGLWFEGRKNLLGDYTCHGLEHVREVMREGEQYLSALEKSGIEVPESLRRSYGVAAKYHDIGMADSEGMELSRELSEKVEQPDSDFSKLVEYYNLDPDATEESIKARRGELVAAAGKNQQKVDLVERNYELQKFILDTKAVAEQLQEMPPNDPERAEMERVYREHLSEIQDIVHSDLRSRHAYKSAEYVLSHSDEMKERYGREVNPRNVACAVMLHTKRNSGCGDLTVLTSKASETENLSVEEACSKLVADWNLNHGDQGVETTFSEADLKEIATVASVLRTADNRRNGKTATFTNGDRVLCEVSGEKVMVYHGKEENGTVRKARGVRSPKSVEIISAESCTRFSEIRPEGSNMVHVMLFDGIGLAPLEQSFAKCRIVDYVGEVESGVFKSAISENGEDGGPSEKVNIIEVHVPGASKSDCIRLEQEWRRLLANGRNQAAKQYGAAGRLRVLPTGKEEST